VVFSDYRRQRDWNLSLEGKFLIAEENRSFIEGSERQKSEVVIM
jgi:hypothetical protein